MRSYLRAFASLIVIVAFVVLGGLRLEAHDNDVGPNGGTMRETKGGHHLELLAKDTELSVFISDANHSPTMSQGASGRAVILESSGQRTVALTPAEPDKLTAKLERALEPGARVVISAKLGSGQELLARFALK